MAPRSRIIRARGCFESGGASTRSNGVPLTIGVLGNALRQHSCKVICETVPSRVLSSGTFKDGPGHHSEIWGSFVAPCITEYTRTRETVPSLLAGSVEQKSRSFSGLTCGTSRRLWHAESPTNTPLFALLRTNYSFAFISHRAHRMSSSSSSSSSNFQLIINNALDAYKKRTKNDLREHTLVAKLESCNTSSAILAVLHQQIQGLDQSRSSDDRWTRWLDPTVNVLFTLSAILGGVLAWLLVALEAVKNSSKCRISLAEARCSISP